MPCFRVGKRTPETTWHFVQDLQARLRYPVQLTTDGFRAYLPAVEDEWLTLLFFVLLALGFWALHRLF